MSMLQFDDDIMPFTFADILILRYLTGDADASKTIEDFELINQTSDLKWAFRSQLVKFIKRFWKDPYRQADLEWVQELVTRNGILVKSKFAELQKMIT